MITKIHIGAFGRLRDFEIELKEGLNLIYGKNESGKSTLSAFIKAAFYGLPPTRVQNLADNDRKRFLPWGGQAMSGRLEVALPGGKAYLIEREFRGIPSKDALRVVEKGTGTKNAALLPVPGEALFGMGLSTFERTAFIGQDRHKINSSDEMIRKLSNMFSSASEEVSYKNATDLLSERKRFYLTARNTGKIGELKSRLLSLEDELSAVKRLKEDAALLFQERRAAEAEMERLESELRQAKERRAAGEVLARAADYEKLAALTQKIGDLELALRLEADKIGGGPLPADEGYLARLEEAYLKAVKAKSYLAPLVKGAEDRAARLAEMRREWDALPESLKRAGADQEVSALEKRIADLAGKAEAARKRSGELSLLRQQKERLAGMRNRGFEQVPADRVLEIMTREGRPRASSGGGVREGMFLGVGLLTLLLSVPLAAVWNRPPYALAAAAAGLGILAVFIRNFLMERKRKKREEADLEAVCALMGVPDAARLKEEYIKEQGLRKETESLEVRIGILEEAAKAGGDLSALETELGREKTRLEEILREADCGSAALFFEKIGRAHV
jgi:uncharacterized protein YhaN